MFAFIANIIVIITIIIYRCTSWILIETFLKVCNKGNLSGEKLDVKGVSK